MDASTGSEAVKAARRPVRLSRRQWWALVLLVVALLVGVWQWRQPRTLRIVARFPTVDVTLVPTAAGFFLREGADLYVLREWSKGQVVWQVTTLPDADNRKIALSQDGRYFAAMTPAGTDRRVQVWRDGTPVSDQLLSHFPVPRAMMRITDDGRVFLWYNKDKVWEAMVLAEGRVIAAGTLGESGGTAAISPDGKAAVIQTLTSSGFRYAKLTVADGKIVRSHEYDAAGSLPMPGYGSGLNDFNTLFAEGCVVTEDGAVYNETGRVAGPDGREDKYFVAPGGRYTLRYTNDSVRVFSPVTGDAWEFPVRGGCSGGDATGDGRHAMVTVWADLPPPIEKLLNWASVALDRDLSLEMTLIALYERPGVLRAVLPERPGRWWKGRDPWAWWWFPAPDGRGIVMNMECDEEKGECLLFR